MHIICIKNKEILITAYLFQLFSFIFHYRMHVFLFSIFVSFILFRPLRSLLVVSFLPSLARKKIKLFQFGNKHYISKVAKLCYRDLAISKAIKKLWPFFLNTRNWLVVARNSITILVQLLHRNLQHVASAAIFTSRLNDTAFFLSFRSFLEAM